MNWSKPKKWFRKLILVELRKNNSMTYEEVVDVVRQQVDFRLDGHDLDRLQVAFDELTQEKIIAQKDDKYLFQQVVPQNSYELGDVVRLRTDRTGRKTINPDAIYVVVWVKEDDVKQSFNQKVNPYLVSNLHGKGTSSISVNDSHIEGLLYKNPLHPWIISGDHKRKHLVEVSGKIFNWKPSNV